MEPGCFLFLLLIGAIVILFYARSKQGDVNDPNFSIKKLPPPDRLNLIENALGMTDKGDPKAVEVLFQKASALEQKVKDLESKIASLQSGGDREEKPVSHAVPEQKPDKLTEAPEPEKLQPAAQTIDISAIPSLESPVDSGTSSTDADELKEVSEMLESAITIARVQEVSPPSVTAGISAAEEKPLSSTDAMMDWEERDDDEDDIKEAVASAPFNTPSYQEKKVSWEAMLLKVFSVVGVILMSLGALSAFQWALRSMGDDKALLKAAIPWTILSVFYLLGVFLIFLGDFYFKKRENNMGKSMMTGGFCILLFTTIAGHFFFHILSIPVMAVILLAIIVASGLTIFRFDTKLVANIVLLIAYLAPFIMKVSLDDLVLIYVYLLSINLAVALVAYFKKWDYYITASFLMTYVHFFVNYRLTHSNFGLALVFLTVFYLMFLVSNNMMHLKKKVAGGFSLFVSYFNPLLYAVVTYGILLNQSKYEVIATFMQSDQSKVHYWLFVNFLALGIYAALGAIHLYLTGRFRKLEELDPRFADITRNNLVLGLLFITSAISFITYFTQDVWLFSLVTALWFIQAFILLRYSFKSGFCDRIFRRYSYLTLGIIWAQMVSVISWMPEWTDVQFAHKYGIYLVSIVLFYLYFKVMYDNRDQHESEDRWMMAASLLSCFALAIYMTAKFLTFFSFLPLLALSAYVIMYLSLKYFDKLGYLRYISYFAFSSLAVLILLIELASLGGNIPGEEKKVLYYGIIAAIYIWNAVTLHQYREHLGEERHLMFNISGSTALFIILALVCRHMEAVSLVSFIPAVLALAALAVLYPALRVPDILGFFRYCSYTLFALSLGLLPIQVISPYLSKVGSTHLNHTPGFIVVSVLFLFNFLLLRKFGKDIVEKEKNFLFNISVITPIMATWLLTFRYNIYATIFITALLTYVLVEIMARFPDVTQWLRKQRVEWVVGGGLTLWVLFIPTKILTPAFVNHRGMLLLGAAFVFLSIWYVIHKHKDRLGDRDNFYHPYFLCLMALVLGKLAIVETAGFKDYSMLSTCMWSWITLLVAFIGLPRAKDTKILTLTVMLLTATFIKAGIDASQLQTSWDMSNAWLIGNSVLTALTILAYYLIQKKVKAEPMIEDVYQAFTLLVFPFLTSAILFKACGMLMKFQIILTIFWSLTAFLYIMIGFKTNNNFTRIFGMILMLAAAAKIFFADYSQLQFVGMMPVLLLDGLLFIATPMIHAKYREKLDREADAGIKKPEETSSELAEAASA